MKIKKVIDIAQEIEVDIRLDEVFDHLSTLPKDIELYWIIDAINTAQAILHRIPDIAIETMSNDRRKLIYDALIDQAKRFEANWKPATPFG